MWTEGNLSRLNYNKSVITHSNLFHLLHVYLTQYSSITETPLITYFNSSLHSPLVSSIREIYKLSLKLFVSHVKVQDSAETTGLKLIFHLIKKQHPPQLY